MHIVTEYKARQSEWVSETCSVVSDSLRPPRLQARILEWVAFSFPGGLPNAGTKTRSPASQADSLPAEQAGKPRQTTETQPQVGEQTDRAWGSRLWAGPEYRGREETSHPEASNPAQSRTEVREAGATGGEEMRPERRKPGPAHLHFQFAFSLQSL